MQKKVLDALIEEMLLDEPQLVMDSILNSIYNHMVERRNSRGSYEEPDE